MNNNKLITEFHLLKIISYSVSLICHIAAGFQYLLIYKTIQTGIAFFTQFFILLILSLAISLILSFIGEKKYVVFIIFAHFVVFTIIGYPLANRLDIELILFTVILVEIVFFTVSPYNIVVSLFLTVITILLQKPVLAWNTLLPAPSTCDIILTGVYSAIIITLTSILKSLFENLKVQKSQVQRLDMAVKQLMTANIGFQQYAKKKEETSKINERKRVTREIHDTIGYTLTNVIMVMEAAISLIKNNPNQINKAEELIQGIKKQAQNGLKEIRKVLYLLREEEDSTVHGLQAIKKISKAFAEATNISVKVDFGNLPWNLGEKCDAVIYKLVQEGMTNAFRHGKATAIWIRFWQNESGIFITIRDNGIGSVKVKKGIGLLGMTERIESLGGKIDAHNITDGFELSVWIPLTSKT